MPRDGQRPGEWVGGTDDKSVFFLGWARPQRSESGTGGKRAGMVGKAGATLSRGWDSAVSPVHLTRGAGNNGWAGAAWPAAPAHLCFPSRLRSPGALLARSLSGKPILSAGPRTAHSFLLISSLRLQAHVLTVRRE